MLDTYPRTPCVHETLLRMSPGRKKEETVNNARSETMPLFLRGMSVVVEVQLAGDLGFGISCSLNYKFFDLLIHNRIKNSLPITLYGLSQIL